MSGKKPPPRPPLPKGHSPVKNTKAVNTPGRLRSALASLSIRYNPTTAATKDSDSEEEIYIVRKEENTLTEQNNEAEDGADEIDRNTRVTEDCDCERPKQGINISNSSSCSLPLLVPDKQSLNGVNKENGDKRTIVKQKTWPGNSTGSGVTSASTRMKFIRRDQEPKNDPSTTNDNKEQADSGSQPSKTHLNLSSMERGSSEQKEGSRPRSPSPFRRLYRQTNNEHVGEKLAATSSAISLSSLLAAAATEDNNAESEKENEEAEDFQDAMPELSGADSLSCEELAMSSELKDSKTPFSIPPKPVHEPPCTFLLFCILLFYIYYISNPPVFVNGMIVGSVIAYLVGCLILMVVCPEDSFDERFQRELAEYNKRLSLEPKRTYTSVDPGLLLRPRGMKGWMLKAYEYDPNSTNETTLVYARLRDNNLTLSLPKLDNNQKKIDIKTVDENTKVSFARHDHFDLTGSNISLTPPTLSPKRIWSKKYPLCIALGRPGEQQEEVKELSEEDLTKQKVKAQSSLDEVNVLYLFAKTGRQKEEWYQHFERILNPKKNVSVSDIDNVLRPSSCSYPHYMAKLLPNPDIDMQDSPEIQLSWVNMLFGRVFWDVWQDRYWADKIKQRFQNKLSKLHKPQFIRDIHITDLSLGHTFPLINKVSLPVLDEKGTWVDFDVTYSGGVVFTLETHLNIDGYLTHFLNLGKENRDITADLDMAELSRKYELMEKEESLKDHLSHPGKEIIVNHDEDDDDGSLTSESPPLSDSDFESPESDLEELTTKQNGSRPYSSGSESAVAVSGTLYAKEALLQLKSLEGFLEKQIAEEEMQFLDVNEFPPQLALSQESLSNTESATNSERNSPVQKQSSGEDSEKSSFLSPPSTPKLTRAPDTPHVSSPVRQRLNQPTGTRKKLIGVLERLAKSKWVKKAAETKIVKTAAEKFSNMPIILSVEVQSVKGTLTLNVPPPPTNRLWYGFRGNPMLFVTARPKLGARQVKLTHVTDWIERKLKQEFKNMFVLPNMEDIPIKIMNSEVEKQFSDN